VKRENENQTKIFIFKTSFCESPATLISCGPLLLVLFFNTLVVKIIIIIIIIIRDVLLALL